MKFLSLLIFLGLIIITFFSWFNFLPLSAGDWGFNFPGTIKNFNLMPFVWSNRGMVDGIGGNVSIILALESYFLILNILFYYLHISWVLAERLIAFWPFLIIVTSSSYLLCRKIFPKIKYPIIASFLFLFNSYILMVVGGGQMGVAIAYSLTPLVLYAFFILVNIRADLKNILLYSLSLSLLIFFDLRVAYMILLSVFLYWLIKQIEIRKLRETIKSFIFVFAFPGIITFLLQSFWILPLIVGGVNPVVELGSAYSSIDSVKFFSFAKFENTISLLHPNWPENIFGKVGFMKPEFLLLPILAFSGLLFIHKVKDRKIKIYVIYFSLLGLIGAFLAKGANEPFGGLYLWMFNHIPGFIMFRDPTKWYMLVALSYSILISYVVNTIIDKIYEK